MVSLRELNINLDKMKKTLLDNFIIEQHYTEGFKYDVLLGELMFDIFAKPNDACNRTIQGINNIQVRIESYDELTNFGVETLKHFIENLYYYKQVISDYILNWYIKEYRPMVKEWMSKEYWEEAQFDPFIELSSNDSHKIEEFICLSSIFIPLQKTAGSFSLCFDTPWEYEHGIGVDFINFKVHKIGGSDSYLFINSEEKKEIRKDQLRLGIVKPSPLEYSSDYLGLGVKKYFRWDWNLLEYVVYKESPIPKK